jgi:hypothetical protein
MPKSKLNLKRTPAEKEERRLKKERRALRALKREARARPKRASVDDDDNYISHDHKRRRLSPSSDEEYGPHPPSTTSTYEDIRTRLENARFQEKLSGAYEDDVGLYGVEERLNAFGDVDVDVRIPERWRNAGVGGKDPKYMEEEEYAEWMRRGMWE